MRSQKEMVQPTGAYILHISYRCLHLHEKTMLEDKRENNK